MGRIVIIGLVLLFSGKLFAGTENTKNLYLSCECEDARKTNDNWNKSFKVKCRHIAHVVPDNFDMNLLYVLDPKGEKNFFRALNSKVLVQGYDLPISGDRYPFSSRDNPVSSLDTEISFDFIIPLYYSMVSSEEYDPFYSYQLLRFAINKYNLNFKINYYFGEQYEQLIEYSLLEKDSDYYLKKQYADMENNLQYKTEGSCLIIEKQL